MEEYELLKAEIEALREEVGSEVAKGQQAERTEPSE
jgi:hypothetical protein